MRSRPCHRVGRKLAVGSMAVAMTAALAGCGSGSADGLRSTGGASGSAGTDRPLSGSLTVFAAASLTGAFTQLGRQFESLHPGTTVKFSFGASSTLAQQIIAGAPADLFASASPVNIEQVTEVGDATAPRTFATNEAEIAVSPRSASKVTSIDDLAGNGVKVALCQPQVPCGTVAAEVLQKAGLTVKPVTRGLDVKSTLAYVTAGEVDAAIVYVTDVRAAGSAVNGVEIPNADNARTAYVMAAVTHRKNQALGRAFESYVLSAAGQLVLRQAGFRGP